MVLNNVGHYIVTRFSRSVTLHVSKENLSTLSKALKNLQNNVLSINYQENKNVAKEFNMALDKSDRINKTIQYYITWINSDSSSLSGQKKQETMRVLQEQYSMVNNLLREKHSNFITSTVCSIGQARNNASSQPEREIFV
ncbi:hypothetical protein [Enterobacter mori]|uniref:hypothetical protein n=1 Tax=Enterobacter mori TaxID=539813 RepID=UPI001B8C79E3|nr:hypothetical protein [Enterobacter mori]MBS3050483.1 hypothetical protein [Enterobacter mori]